MVWSFEAQRKTAYRDDPSELVYRVVRIYFSGARQQDRGADVYCNSTKDHPGVHQYRGLHSGRLPDVWRSPEVEQLRFLRTYCRCCLFFVRILSND